MSRPTDWPVRIIQLLAVPGMLISFYLLLYHQGQLFIVCDISGWDNCGAVSGPTARYSAIGPVPIALIGLIGYAMLFLIAWLQDWIRPLREYSAEILVGLAGIAFLFSLGLTALEILVIQAICRYCLLSALIVTVIMVMAVIYALTGRRQEARAFEQPGQVQS